MTKAWMTAATLAALAGGAAAQTYVEGAYGVTHVAAECRAGTTCDKTDKGFKLLAGYTLAPSTAPRVSVEAGYINFGSVRVSSGNPVGLVRARLDTEAFFVGGALRTPSDIILEDSVVVVRAGLARVKSKGSQIDVPTGQQGSDSATAVRPLLGVGLHYNIKPELALTASLDLTRTAGLHAWGSHPVGLFSLGAQYTIDPKPLVMDAGPAGPKGPQPNYVYGELGIVHSDGLDVLKRKHPGVYEFSDNPLGWRLGVGRRWGQVWSTELALTSYGRYKFHTAASVLPEEDGSVEAAGLSAMSVWRAPTDMGLTWVARLGLSHNVSRIETTTGTVTVTDDRKTTAPIVGLGLEHALDKNWRLMFTADATRIRVGDDRPLVKFYAAGGSYRF
jgi:hypothetical protein